VASESSRDVAAASPGAFACLSPALKLALPAELWVDDRPPFSDFGGELPAPCPGLVPALDARPRPLLFAPRDAPRERPRERPRPRPRPRPLPRPRAGEPRVPFVTLADAGEDEALLIFGLRASFLG